MSETKDDKAWFKSEEEEEDVFENSDADMENDNSTDSPSVDESQKTNDHQDATPPSEEDKKQTEENADDDDSKEEDVKEKEKPDDFAKHPAWQEREKKWKKRYDEQELRHSDSIAEIRKEIGGINKKDETPIEIPDWFGGDEKQWKEYRRFDEDRIEKVKEDVKREVLETSQEEQKKIDEATDYMNEQIKEIESEAGEKIDKNKLLKITLDNELIDTKGKWNYKAGFKIMKASGSNNDDKKKSIEERKKLAGATTSDKKSEEEKPTFRTNKDFEDPAIKPW